MQPNAAPPPITPSGQKPGQYDFLFHEPPKKSKFNLPLNPNNQKQRILLVAGAAVILLFIGIVVFSLIAGSGNKNSEELFKVAQQQAELVRIAEIGKTKARSTTAKNLAVTTSLTLTSDQASLVKLISPKPSAKKLALGKNSDTDKLLTQADQNNNFDAAFVTELQKELKAYQASMKQAYDHAPTKKIKDALSVEYKNASLLAGVNE